MQVFLLAAVPAARAALAAMALHALSLQGAVTSG